MPREKTKEYVPFNCKLEKRAAESLDKLCNETGLTKTAAVERALIAYYERFKKTGRV